MKNSTLFTFVLLLFCVSCADRTWQAEYDAVMEIHDEVMPETSTINKIKKSIKKYNQTIKDTNPELSEQALNLMRKLDKADEGMYDWMHQFDKPTSMEHEAAVKYLNDQKVKISQVSKDMKSSIAEGRAFLKQVGAAQ